MRLCAQVGFSHCSPEAPDDRRVPGSTDFASIWAGADLILGTRWLPACGPGVFSSDVR